MTCETDEWHNCYDGGWQNILTPAAFAHPAKYSLGLITRIINHALDEGWIQPGSTVLDPFGGVACGAWPCLRYGLHWVGVELESKFVELGRENIALWNDRYAAHFPNWGSAQIYQGDSRRLAEVVSAAGLVVSSPPYAESEGSPSGGRLQKLSGGTLSSAAQKAHGMTAAYGSTPGQLATLPPGTPPTAIVSSPPFAGNSGGRGEASRNGPSTRSGGPIDPGLFDRHSGGMKGGTGSDPANLDHLPMGTLRLAQDTAPPMAIVSSPPYAESLQNHGAERANNLEGSQNGLGDYGSAPGQLGAMKPGQISAVIASPPYAEGLGHDAGHPRLDAIEDKRRAEEGSGRRNGYSSGQTEGQLGGMKAGVAVVGSPPFRDATAGSGKDELTRSKGLGGDYDDPLPFEKRGFLMGKEEYQEYAQTCNLGSFRETSNTFWAAARLIVEQCALLLPPNGVAIWVVKSYVKSGKIVDFPGQWQALCEACGFETVHIHRAMLVKENGAQGNMFGADKKNKVQRKSFFRLMFEAKQKAAKHWLTLSREDQATVLWRAHGELWRDYWTRLALFELSDEDKEKAGVKIDMAAPTRPTRKKILGDAKTAAWVRDGKIDYEIATSIDYESILCMRKAA